MYCLEDESCSVPKGTTGTQASFMELFDGDEETSKEAGSDDRRKNGI